MKKVKIYWMFLLLTILIGCNANHTPDPVSDAFDKKFPEAKSVSWEKESNTEWEAEFKIDGISYSANFDLEGNWKETEHKVDINAIPEVVKKSLDQEYSYYKIEESEISETPTGTFYEFKILSEKSRTEVSISSEGKIIKKEP